MLIELTGSSVVNYQGHELDFGKEKWPRINYVEEMNKILGFDFLDISREGNLEAKEAYEKGGTILTNPFTLAQGGVGMAGRAPVMLTRNDKQRLWGLVTVTIDFDNLISVLKLDSE